MFLIINRNKKLTNIKINEKIKGFYCRGAVNLRGKDERMPSQKRLKK